MPVVLAFANRKSIPVPAVPAVPNVAIDPVLLARLVWLRQYHPHAVTSIADLTAAIIKRCAEDEDLHPTDAFDVLRTLEADAVKTSRRPGGGR